MEWLAEIGEIDVPPDEDFFETTEGERRPDKTLPGRLFMVFTNQDALREILSLWKAWQEDGKLPYGFGVWKRFSRNCMTCGSGEYGSVCTKRACSTTGASA